MSALTAQLPRFQRGMALIVVRYVLCAPNDLTYLDRRREHRWKVWQQHEFKVRTANMHARMCVTMPRRMVMPKCHWALPNPLLLPPTRAHAHANMYAHARTPLERGGCRRGTIRRVECEINI